LANAGITPGVKVRREPEFFGDLELILIYMARRLPDALKLERLLTEAQLDYHVETGTYTGGFLMRRDLAGAFFYVAPVDVDSARAVLLQNKYKPYEEE
jgi:hypothetical protein